MGIGGIVSGAAEAARRAAEAAQQAAQQAAEAAKKAAEAAAEKAGDAAQKAGEATQEGVEKAGEAAAGAAQGAASFVADRARDTFQEGKDAVSGVASKTKQAAEGVADKTTDAARGAREQVQDTAEGVKDKAQETYQQARGVKETLDKAAGVVGTARAIAGKAQEAKGALDELRKNPEGLSDAGQKAVERGGQLLDGAIDAVKNHRLVQGAGKAAEAVANSKPGQAIGNTVEKLKQSEAGKLFDEGRAAKAVGDFAKGVGTAAGDLRQAARSLSAGDVAQAARSAKSVAGGLGEEARKQLGENLQKANEGLKRIAPDVSRKAEQAATALSARANQLKEGGEALASRAGQVASESAQRIAQSAAGQVAGEVAEKVGLKGAARFAGKAAGRFVPGANVAVAGLDVANAVATQRDPDASALQKGLGWATAAGSVVGATNIPVLSQAGAAFSLATSAVSSFLP